MKNIFLNTGNQAEKDSDLEEMGNKENEPYNCHIYSLESFQVASQGGDKY